jgi:hypothetical protein
VIYVENSSHFPPPVSGVITLLSNKIYIVTKHIDLISNRLKAVGVAVVLGLSSEKCSIINNNAHSLIEGNDTFIMERLTLTNTGGPVLMLTNTSVDPTGGAIDWELVNINGDIGTVSNYRNCIFVLCAFFDAYNWVFDGTIGTVGFDQCLFSVHSNETLFTLPSTLILTRRFRVIYSSFIVPAGSIGINASVSSTIPVEAYILDTVNFSGAGVYIAGILGDDNRALFKNNVGITNTSVRGVLLMMDNATPTVISNTTSFFKVLGTTTIDSNQRFSMPLNNRLLCNAVIQRSYMVITSLTFISGTNNVCEFGIFNSSTNNVIPMSMIVSTANSGGRAENITLTSILSMVSGDFIELYCKNTTGFNNITVERFTMIIVEI